MNKKLVSDEKITLKKLNRAMDYIKQHTPCTCPESWPAKEEGFCAKHNTTWISAKMAKEINLFIQNNRTLGKKMTTFEDVRHQLDERCTDSEEYHMIFDSLIEKRLKELDPEFLRKMKDHYKRSGCYRWYA